MSCPRTQHNVPGQDPNPDHSIRSRALEPCGHHASSLQPRIKRFLRGELNFFCALTVFIASPTSQMYGASTLEFIAPLKVCVDWLFGRLGNRIQTNSLPTQVYFSFKFNQLLIRFKICALNVHFRSKNKQKFH